MSSSEDLHVHFINRLRRLCVDIANTCEIAELSPIETTEIIMSGLFTELVQGAVALEMSEVNFGKLARLAYRQICKHKTIALDNF